MSLNPYSTGIWSATEINKYFAKPTEVLILILLEYGLRPAAALADGDKEAVCLNPYSTGIWSATIQSNVKYCHT